MSFCRLASSVLFVAALCAAQGALAQQDAATPDNMPIVMPAPPTEEGGSRVLPPVPLPGRVPELSPSRACALADLQGYWKLLHVYEEPQGPETSLFYASPSQYMRFGADSTFDILQQAQDDPIAPETLPVKLASQKQGVQQYVVGPTGQVYYYRDSVAFNQEACFIVVTPNTYFKPGQMLLMPPNPQSPTRWVKVYSKIWMAPAVRQATPAQAEQPKKKQRNN